jgi:plasmid stabilization system protein ParE
MYILNFSESFREDVKSSVSYIKDILQAPAAAQRLKGEIKASYKKLKKTPFIYPVVPDENLASKGLRFMMVKNYMMFYVVDNKDINIIRFLYGRRDWITILGNM